MPRLPVSLLSINPQHNRAIAAHDYVFRLKNGVGVLSEPRSPEGHDCGLALDSPAIRCRGSIFKDSVIREPGCEGLRIVPVECLVESVNDHSGFGASRIRILL